MSATKQLNEVSGFDEAVLHGVTPGAQARSVDHHRLSNPKNSIWHAIQEPLGAAGFVVAGCSER